MKLKTLKDLMDGGKHTFLNFCTGKKETVNIREPWIHWSTLTEDAIKDWKLFEKYSKSRVKKLREGSKEVMDYIRVKNNLTSEDLKNV